MTTFEFSDLDYYFYIMVLSDAMISSIAVVIIIAYVAYC